MRKEALFYKNRVKPVLDRIPGIEYERVELKTGKAGMPDIVYSHGGTGWIEMKWNDTTDYIDLSKWTRPQRRFAARYPRVLLFVGNPDVTYIIDPTKVGAGVKRLNTDSTAIVYQFCSSSKQVSATVASILYWRGFQGPTTGTWA